jgi:hypothetical protein
MSGYSAPLQVVGFIASRRGDAERGPLVRVRSDDARLRLLQDGELAWVEGPRRRDLAQVVIDDTLPRGGVVLRDILGVAVSDVIRVIKPDFDRERDPRAFA